MSGILARVSGALQSVFGECAREACAETGVIQRQRKFTATSLAQAFVLAYLKNPRANDCEIAKMAQACGVDVSHQAVSQRHNERLAAFFQSLFEKSCKVIVAADKALVPILNRFSEVTLLDSTVVKLPDNQADRFRGCGGGHGTGKSALKLQTEFDLRSGAIQSIQIEQGRQTDSASSRQYADRRPGSLRITDLGYFNVKVFREIAESRAYFLTRLNFQTAVFLNGEKLPNLIKWLQSQTDEAIDLEVEVGAGVSLPCRMLASRVPPAVARRRRKRLRENCQRKRGRAPSKDALAACDWTVVITNVPAKKLSYAEAFVLCRARWQIELLFKRWKSQGLIAEMHARSDTHSMIQLWARLTVALIQHWLMIGVVWTNGIQQSFSRTIAATRDLALTIALFIGVKKKLIEMLQLICRTTKRTCLRTQRSRLGTFELMLTPESSAYP